ncbi:hypothetical protein Tco_0949692, partial [Tanacetum coccineum]
MRGHLTRVSRHSSPPTLHKELLRYAPTLVTESRSSNPTPDIIRCSIHSRDTSPNQSPASMQSKVLRFAPNSTPLEFPSLRSSSIYDTAHIDQDGTSYPKDILTSSIVVLSQNRRDLPRDIPLDSVVVLRYEKRSKSENKGKVPTEMELVLEQTQQGTSYEVSVSAEGVEELKRKVKIKGEKKEALLTLRQKPGFLGGTIVVEVSLVKGHLFPSIAKVRPVGFDPLELVELFTPVEVNK